MKKISLVASIILAASLFTGCAFKNQKIAVEYNSDNIKAHQHGEVCLNKFEDDRADKSRIGIVKNRLGMETANILTDQDIAVLVSKAVEEELVNLGYKVYLTNVQYTDGQNNANNCTFVDGKIKNFFVEPVRGLVAVDGKSVITVNLIIQKEDGTELKKTYSANGESRSYMGTASLFKESMDDALSKLIKKIKADMPSIIKG